MKYEEDFAKIQAATQIRDFDKLVEIFIKNEEKVVSFVLVCIFILFLQNFQMFKFVNELSNEIEDLEKQIYE